MVWWRLLTGHGWLLGLSAWRILGLRLWFFRPRGLTGHQQDGEEQQNTRDGKPLRV
jgi:hypothetical protein